MNNHQKVHLKHINQILAKKENNLAKLIYLIKKMIK